MKKYAAAAAILAAFALASIGVRAQEAAAVTSASSAFAQIQPDMQGMVTQPITHTASGDMLAAYIGHAPKQVYTKTDQTLYVISGNGTVSVGYPSYDVSPGSVISIPRNTAFEITAHGRDAIKAILIASPGYDASDKKVLETGQ